MDPITIAMLASTAAGGLSSIIGGVEQNRANQVNEQISLQNFYRQIAAQRNAQVEAQRQQGEAKQGTTDAAGNRTYFVPGRGWVTDLSENQQALQTGTEQEQLRALTDDTARNRVIAGRNEGRQGQEDALASMALRELQGVQRPDQDALRQLFLARGAETRNDAADRAGEMVARQGIRAGGGVNAAELTRDARAASDAQSSRQAGVDAQLSAMQTADSQYNSDIDRASKMYDYFRRASTAGATPVNGYSPQGPQARSTGSADQQLLSIMRGSPQMEYQSPNYAMGDTLTDLSKLGMSAVNTKHQIDMDNELLKRWGANTGAIS